MPFSTICSHALVLKWKITCMSDWSLTSSMFELMVNSWWLDWYWCDFQFTGTPPHAAALPSSCQCCSSTPCATKPKIPATPTMTASSCPRWAVVPCLVMSFLLGFSKCLETKCIPPFMLLFSGPCCSYSVCCLGRGWIHQRVWAAKPAQDRLWPGGSPHPCE